MTIYVEAGLKLKVQNQDWALLPVLDRGQLEDSTSGDAQFAQEILDTYLLRMPEALVLLNAAIVREDRDSLRYHAHSSKGSSQAVGARRIGSICTSIERLADFSGAEDLVQVLASEFRQYRALVTGLGLYQIKAT